jgi:hypothetical protein
VRRTVPKRRLVVRTDDCIVGWKSHCQHEAWKPQSVTAKSSVVSTSRRLSETVDATLVAVEVTVEDDAIKLTDDRCTFIHERDIGDDDDMPSSSSDLTF